MTASPLSNPRFFVRDPLTDLPLVGGRVWTYEAGTVDTPKRAYTDAGQNGVQANPIVLEADGGKDVFFEGLYKLRVERPDGALLYEIDGFGRPASTLEDAAFGPLQIETVDYNVSLSDNRKLLVAQRPTPITFNLPACAEMGDSFQFVVKNIGGGTLTIDPFQSETIDGNVTLAIPTGGSAFIYCDGTALTSFFLG